VVGLEFRVSGLRCRGQGLEPVTDRSDPHSALLRLRFGVWDLGFGLYCYGLWFMVYNIGFMV
jgi:hypothetical protein